MRTAHVADETEVVDRAPEQSEDEKGHATHEEGHARGHPDPEELLVFVPNCLKRQRQARVVDHGCRVVSYCRRPTRQSATTELGTCGLPGLKDYRLPSIDRLETACLEHTIERRQIALQEAVERRARVTDRLRGNGLHVALLRRRGEVGGADAAREPVELTRRLHRVAHLVLAATR